MDVSPEKSHQLNGVEAQGQSGPLLTADEVAALLRMTPAWVMRKPAPLGSHMYA
jgi:hypothetical protein